MKKNIKVVIAGINGYAGRELVSLIQKHPALKLCGILGTDYLNLPQFTVEALNQGVADLLILATPADVSLQLVAQIRNKFLKIIDLSGAFRLSESEFSSWYGQTHTSPVLLKEACYGLYPWENKQASGRLIANPGCYATCALMSLVPLVKAGLIAVDSLIIDAKSGLSGAGKKANETLMYCEMADNVLPYKINSHQHLPEIQNYLQLHTQQSVGVTLTTTMIPVTRGISMNIYAKTLPHVTLKIITEAFEEAYKDYPLVDFAVAGKKDALLLPLKQVSRTCKTHIVQVLQGNQLILFSSIDNLLKGAASQALENINAMYNLPGTTGLLEEVRS